MGQCVSCIGAERRESADEDEEAHLIFGDARGTQYGSFADQQGRRDEDPIETQRGIEALQRVVAQTSDNLVDVFDIIPPERANPSTSAHFAFPSDDGQQARYQTLLTRLSTKEGGPVARIEWQHQDEEGNSQQEAGALVKSGKEASEPLVGNFVDAAAAMR